MSASMNDQAGSSQHLVWSAVQHVLYLLWCSANSGQTDDGVGLPAAAMATAMLLLQHVDSFDCQYL